MELGRWLKHACAIFIVLLLHINASLSLGHHHANVTARCIERERDALLAIKGDLVDKHNLLSSWEGEDCCGWERVHCDHQTGHVIQLHLGGVPQVFSWSGRTLIGEYNPPKTLQGEISPTIIELQYLEYLDLSYNSLNATQIPALIYSLSNLRHLDLSFNDLYGSKIPELIGNLTNLRYLDLSENFFSGEIPTHMFSLSNLRYLDLQTNSVNVSNIPELIGNLTFLRYLDLSSAFTDDEIPIPFPNQLGNLTHLQYLYLHFTPFTFNHGNLNCLPHLSSLKYLDMTGTNLSKASDWLETISKLPNLRNLTLWRCDLPPPILSTLSHINSSSSLIHVSLSENVVTASIFKWLYNHNTTLAYLDLYYTQLSRFSGSIPDVFSNMGSLEYLGLTFNQFNGSIPDVFSNMRSLKNLYLMGNQFSGSISDVFKDMSSLEDLDLSSNQLSGLSPNAFRNLSSLASLVLSSNQLSGLSPNAFTNMSSLATLDLSSNQLSGLSPNAFANMSSLATLDLSANQLSGNISHFIQVLSTCRPQSSLKELYLEGNNLTGTIPDSIGQMSNLETIRLGNNSLEGMISQTHFSKLFNLKELDLSSNSLVLDFHSEWIPPFQLRSIGLGSCTMGPDFPEWIRTQKNVHELDISNGAVADVLPSWFWDLFSNALTVDLSSNQLRGTIGDSSLRSEYNPQLNLSWNQFEGPIPSFFSRASSLDLSNNRFSYLESFLCPTNLSNLTFLDLSSNHLFSDQLPDCWAQFPLLLFLDLSNNSLSGRLPTTMGLLSSINVIKLNDNRFWGELPSSLKNCTGLQVIDLGGNNMSGLIPQWIGVGFPNLVVIVFRSNYFNGSMPLQLCYLTNIQILDFSFNHLSGSIPKCLNNLTTLATKGDKSLTISSLFTFAAISDQFEAGGGYNNEISFIWKGTMSKFKSTLGLVKIIDLSSNRLSGEIPSEITHLVGLVSLNLSRNNLTGQIPLDIGKLKSLESLDLSRNKIGGGIPTSLAHIDRLSVMDLSYNNLSGEIPTGTQLQGYNASSYTGNPLLCGPPLHVCNPEGTGPPNVSSGEDDADELITQGFYICLGLGFAVGFWGVCGSLIFKRSWRYAYYNFLNASNDWLYVKVALIKRKLRILLNRQQS